MKPGLEIGEHKRISVTVTDDMFPSFGGHVVHPVLSTVAMVHHMEWVGRLVILPYLKDDEEGIGGGISVAHLAPAPDGTVVTFTAEVTEVTSAKVVCQVFAHHDRGRVGEGTLTQFILPKKTIQSRIELMKQPFEV